MSDTDTVEILPWLPVAWLEYIDAGEYVQRARKGTGERAAWRWIRKRPDGEGEPCKQMEASLQVGLANLEESASGAAHDELTTRSYELMGLAVEGHRGAYTALVRLGSAFIAEVAERRRAAALAGQPAGTVRSEDEARREVNRAVIGAVSLMRGHLEQPEMVEAGLGNGSAACGCWDGSDDDPAGAKDPGDYTDGDEGNAEHLRDLADGNLLWLTDRKLWAGYDSGCGLWVWKGADHGGRLALRVAKRIRMALDIKYAAMPQASTDLGSNGFSDRDALEKQVKMLQANLKRASAATGMKSMLDVAKFMEEMVDSSSNFDQNRRLLHLPDGQVIELREDGVHVRPAAREDRGTKATATPYVPGATHPKWEDYLNTFLPDDELRAYVQRLFGYALLGYNSERKFVLLHGPSSTGKSTIVEAVGAALGDYAGPFSSNMMKSKSEESGRPDIIKAMTRRLIYASELSSSTRLHADMIKNLTGGDTMDARLFRDNDFNEGVPAFTPFIATNALPRINGSDGALLDRRLVVVPFDLVMPKSQERSGASSDLRGDPAALQAVLAWLVEGWKMYLAKGLDDMPEDVLARTKKAKGAVSDEHTWFYENIERVPVEMERDHYLICNDIWKRYQLNMLAEGVDMRDMSKHKFAYFLSSQGIKEPGQKKIDGKKEYIRWGVRWAKPMNDEG